MASHVCDFTFSFLGSLFFPEFFSELGLVFGPAKPHGSLSIDLDFGESQLLGVMVGKRDLVLRCRMLNASDFRPGTVVRGSQRPLKGLRLVRLMRTGSVQPVRL